jgi:pSer/pThr/pTyr-binding forkhead associated (FHA) protein
MSVLKMLRGPEPGRIIDLDKDQIKIGRGRKNDIIIHDNEVSREHCILVRVLDDFEIHDLKSTNGTFVNGQAVDDNGWLLTSRCIIELGDSITLQYMVTQVEDSGIVPHVPQMMPDPSIYTNKKLYLVLAGRNADTAVYELDSATITIGRDLNNDIVLQDAQISRFHVRLVRDEQGYVIEDLETLNGTYLNEQRLYEPIRLQIGQRFRLGTQVHLWYTDSPSDVRVTQAMEAGAEETYPSRRAIDPIVASHQGLQTGQLEDHIFVAYARPHWQGMVQHLYHYLHENGVSLFVEQFYAPNSEEWHDAIEQAQAECVLFGDGGVGRFARCALCATQFATFHRPRKAHSLVAIWGCRKHAHHDREYACHSVR